MIVSKEREWLGHRNPRRTPLKYKLSSHQRKQLFAQSSFAILALIEKKKGNKFEGVINKMVWYLGDRAKKNPASKKACLPDQ